MWRLKQFMPKEHSGLEGRTLDIGNLKVSVRNVIGEGGFSWVYHARDAVHPQKQYALKHMICNDEETLNLVTKEISVMKSLNGHPNIVSLRAHAILVVGRTKEVFLVMEFCEKSLASVLEIKGSEYFEEKQILLIFRDVCSAVLAMHSQSPPIAHRDLKAENVLLGLDGAWKLCDFGSTSTNHQRIDKPEEMGVEEDNIRKHTTPAYRAPEMWDLFRKEYISEKVDIWALGCLLYRICYLKLAFDGESKLQVLNGNYRIPDLPRYSSSLVDLIKSMLQASPNDRPDITQVWIQINNILPDELKQNPETPIHVKSVVTHSPSAVMSPMHSLPPPMHTEGSSTIERNVPVISQRDSLSPPSREQATNISSPSISSHEPSMRCILDPLKARRSENQFGSFWSSEYEETILSSTENSITPDKGKVHGHLSKNIHNNPQKHSPMYNANSTTVQRGQTIHHCKSSLGNEIKNSNQDASKDFEIRFYSNDSEKVKVVSTRQSTNFEDEAFNSFIAEFDTTKLKPVAIKQENEGLVTEMNRLKEQLSQVKSEKHELASKFEKLSSICRSQRQEIQELKKALASKNSPTTTIDDKKNKNTCGIQLSNNQPREKIEGTVWELEDGMFGVSSSSSNLNSQPWKAFNDEPISQHLTSNCQRLVPPLNGIKPQQIPQMHLDSNTRPSVATSISSQRFNCQDKLSSQPSGWAGF